MKMRDYLKDKILFIWIFLSSIILINIIFYIFSVNVYMSIIVNFIIIVFVSILSINDFYKRSKFYNELINNLNLLDKKYLVLETISETTFLDANILYDVLYDAFKSMQEEILEEKRKTDSFIEYVEMFIHEVKIPLSSLTLMTHNYKDKISKKTLKEVKRIDDYLEQILYYIRSNFANNDYLIEYTKLENVINKVLLKNKYEILENKIDIKVDVNEYVYTDSKWLEFILNQIVNNSIKYKKDINSSCIKFYVVEDKTSIKLKIYDNGIGINERDLKKVFDKCFTGENGRKYNSTGIGLYIVKKMCNQLGHVVSIDSHLNEFTEVTIEFGKNDLYKID